MKTFKIACCILFFTAALAVSGPVSHFGYLQTCKISGKGQICGSKTGSSTPIMVKGPSLHWSVGQGQTFYKREAVDWFVDNMQIGIIRAAMAIKYFKENTEGLSTSDPNNKNGCVSCFGYLSGGNAAANKQSQKNLIQKIIDAAVANDIYVIVDWHSHNANNEKSEAVAFFRDMANANKNVPNIIWELYNEPVSDNATTIKNYANDVISAIRGTGNENLIVVGSRDYSKNPNEQRQSAPTDSKNNTAYSFHFYSNQPDHSYNATSSIGGSANNARNAGYTVFATEWGSVNANGGGGTGGYSSWVNFMDTSNTSGCYWSASDINEGASIFKNGTNISDLLTGTVSSVLTASGNVFKDSYMNTKKWMSYVPAGDPLGNDISDWVNEGEPKTWETELGLNGTIKDVKILDGTGTVAKTNNSITYTPLLSNSSTQAYIIYTVTNGLKDVQRRIVANLTNFRPILPEKPPKDVSRKAPSYVTLVIDLGATDTKKRTLVFSSVNVNGGGIAEIIGAKSDSIKFTPPSNIANAVLTTFTLTYSVQVQGSPSLASTQTITLNAKNMTPTVMASGTIASKPNDAPFKLSVANFGGKDADGDSLWFMAYYLHPDYPGSLTKIAPDTLLYTPAPNKIGVVRILVGVTDGIANSAVGNSKVTLTGTGEEITASPDLTGGIPGYSPIKFVPVYTGGLSLQTIGSGKLLVNFAKSGVASLDIYSISGARVASLMNGSQSAGSYEFNIGNLQKGVYVIRLKQGSEVKILRTVVK